MTFNAENGEKWASQLWKVSNDLGHAQILLDNLAKHGSPAIMEEKENYEKIIIDGEDIIRGLRSIAQRLDRAVCIKNQIEE